MGLQESLPIPRAEVDAGALQPAAGQVSRRSGARSAGVAADQGVSEAVGAAHGILDAGRPLASGIYVYRLVTGEGAQTRKLTLLR